MLNKRYIKSIKRGIFWTDARRPVSRLWIRSAEVPGGGTSLGVLEHNNNNIFVLISFPLFLFQFLLCYILEREDKKWFKRDIIVLISSLILFVSTSFPVNIGKEMSLSGFRRRYIHSNPPIFHK